MFLNKKRIELHLPSSWNQMSQQQLETVAAFMVTEAKRTNILHPFDMAAVKTKVFFALTHTKVVTPTNPRLPIEKQYFLCKRDFSSLPWYKRLIKKCQNNPPFQMYLEQIAYWQKRFMGWMDGKPQLTVFPYPIIKRGWKRTLFQGPSALMQDFTWQRFRFAQEYLQYYIQQENLLNIMRRKVYKYSTQEVKKQTKHTDLAKAMFLATIFSRKVNFVENERESVKIRRDFRYTSNQSSDNAQSFRNFNECAFQVILIWWSSIMHYLHTHFPHCYGEQKTKNNKPTNPLEVYTRTTAVLEKYTHIKEEDINNQLYMVVLQHLENMAVETEELEKSKRNTK